MKELISTIILLLFGRKTPTQEDHPTGVYRSPGKFEDVEEPTPVVKEENKTIKKFKALREKLSKMSYKDFLEKVWDTLFGLGVVGVVGGILFLLGSVIFSKGNVDYCYIERWTYIKETTSGVAKPPMNPGVTKDTEKPENTILSKEQNVVIVYELKGHRNWRNDRDIGRFDSLESAIEGSHKLNCAVEAK